MTPDMARAAPCGLYCGECNFLGGECRGCNEQQGKPFWTGRCGAVVCPIYHCCINQKHLKHCGRCGDFPCETFDTLRDPSLSDEQAAQALRGRRSALMSRKEIGT